MQKAPNPLTDKKDIQRNPDSKIDQDFPGFPHGIATEKLITPETPVEKKVAAVNVTDGEKISKASGETDEAASDGSSGAFKSTENMEEDDE